MANLPTSVHLIDPTRTRPDCAIDVDAIRDVVAQIGGSEAWAAESEIAIASGSVTPTLRSHSIETEGAASADDLSTAATTNLPEGHCLRLSAATAGHTVTVKHEAGGSGQFHLATDADFALDQTDKSIDFERRGNDWYEIGRCWGNDNSSAAFLAFFGIGTAAPLDAGTDAGEVVVMAAGPKLPAVDGSDLTGIEERGEYLLFIDLKTIGTDGGTFTMLTWQTRDITTEVVDESGAASLASNRITLPVGTYYCRISCPAFGVTGHKARLYELTGTIAQVLGTSEYATTNVQTRSEIVGIFTITAGNVSAGQNIFEVQHRCQLTKSTDGLGKSFGGGYSETYTIIELWRVI